jgi:aminoglycoside phosphotransferase (APT) family kinase protein
LNDEALSDIAKDLFSYYSTKFPSWRGVNISQFSRVGEGWENDVFSFRLERIEGEGRQSEDLVLRIYAGDGAGEKAKREFGTMKRLSEQSFPVPRVVLLESGPTVFGRPFVVMEKIQGRLLGEIYLEASWGKRRELMRMFCKMFVDLHRLKWEVFARDPEVYTKRNPQVLILDKISETQERFRSLGKTEFDPIFDWLRSRTSTVRFGEPSLIHWDYHPWNVIVRSDGEPFVLDWTQAEVLDFRFDLGWTLVLIATHAHPRLAASVLQRYEQIARKKAEQMEYFEVAACLKRLFAVSVSVTHGPERIGMRSGAEEVLKQHSVPLKRVYAMLRRITGIAIPEGEKLLQGLE